MKTLKKSARSRVQSITSRQKQSKKIKARCGQPPHLILKKIPKARGAASQVRRASFGFLDFFYAGGISFE
jgi:hypothetical protein